MHFTEALLAEIAARGVQVCFLTLHVGLGTFAPVKAETLAAHTMHEERYELSEETARAINEAKVRGPPGHRRRHHHRPRAGERSPREPLTRHPLPVTRRRSTVVAGAGKTRIFIHPPYDFKIVDALLTNFHLPRSTLLMLVSAFAAPNSTRGRDLILSAYAEAIRERYRFFSYGDAMLIL